CVVGSAAVATGLSVERWPAAATWPAAEVSINDEAWATPMVIDAAPIKVVEASVSVAAIAATFMLVRVAAIKATRLTTAPESAPAAVAALNRVAMLQMTSFLFTTCSEIQPD